MNINKKTRWMNIVGAVGIALLGLGLAIDGLLGSREFPLGAMFWHALAIALAVLSGRAVGAQSTPKLRAIAKWSNVFMIGLGAFAAVVIVTMSAQFPAGMAMLAVIPFLFVVPQVINLQALKRRAALSVEQTG